MNKIKLYVESGNRKEDYISVTSLLFTAKDIFEEVQVIDLALWRYATLDKNYLVKLKK